MSDVLTSHSPFKKRTKSEVNGFSSQEGDAIETRPCDLADAPQPGNDGVKPEQDAASSVESISHSALEEELDRAEFEPYIDNGLGEEAYTLEEAKDIRSRLISVGPSKFIEEYLTKNEVPVRKLVTAFGHRPDLPYGDAFYYRLLGVSIQKEIQKRQKLPQYNTIDDAVQLLKDRKNVIVITGAGISTSLGIPDFRSKNTGFYSQLLARGFDSPEDVFDIENFDQDPSHFYDLAGEILPVLDKFSPTHAFIRLMQDKGKLLTNYTQNIDNIEAVAGIKPEHLIQCHGSWATATCRKCQARVPGESIFEDVKAQRVAKCKACINRLKAEKPRKRKRGSNSNSSSRSRGKSSFSDSEDEGQYDIPEPGVMKPDITFFGEKLPNTFFDRLTEHDRDTVDLVIVVGTSMKVAPVSDIPNYLSNDVPQIYISREPADHINFDITLLGYCDEVVAELCRRAGWTLNHPMVPPGFKASVEACEGTEACWKIKPS